MAWAAEDKVWKGSIAFVIWWLLAVFPAFPLLPIGRTAGSLVGASLMVIFGVISSEEAFNAVDLPILGLLFATMVISVYLERAKAFDYLAQALSWKTKGGKDLLIRVCVLAAFSSALFTNDSTCVVLTGFVLKLCKEKGLDPKPFLIALACSSNIGSAATPIGNPQNLVIAVQGKLGFWQFVAGVLPAVVVGLGFNIIGLLLVYGGSLSLVEKLGDRIDGEESGFLPASSPGLRNRNFSVGSEEEEEDEEEAAKSLLAPRSCSFNVELCPGRSDGGWKTYWAWWSPFLKNHKAGVSKVALFVGLVGIWIVGATMHTFEAGVGLPWTAITAAVILTVVDFSDATEILDKV